MAMAVHNAEYMALCALSVRAIEGWKIFSIRQSSIL